MWRFLRGIFPGKNQHNQARTILAQIDRNKIPAHVAIIMDGNGRWAKKRGLPRTVGHRYGVEALRQVIEASVDLKVSVLTVYAFSTENWKRPKEEVNILMGLIVEYLQKEISEMHRQNIKINTIGHIEELPVAAQRELAKAVNLTKGNTGLKLNLALNYGGRMEILAAAKSLAQDIEKGTIRNHEITEELFSAYFFTAGQPDPDLLIRPSGELRISNFLLWQLAYAEMYFTDTYWPDFNKAEYYRALLAYQNRDRRYGGV